MNICLLIDLSQIKRMKSCVFQTKEGVGGFATKK